MLHFVSLLLRQLKPILVSLSCHVFCYCLRILQRTLRESQFIELNNKMKILTAAFMLLFYSIWPTFSKTHTQQYIISRSGYVMLNTPDKHYSNEKTFLPHQCKVTQNKEYCTNTPLHEHSTVLNVFSNH